jgi:CBS-domain-containing membrane protein|tara:strand:+ start:575 stop:1051 length:477 start_codon:yes stop_codon:yes gene_type:complete
MNLIKKILSLDALLSAIGAFVVISFLSFLNSSDSSNLWIIPPFGATMVLVMAAHESPLAQPRNIFFGHTLSAASGVLIYFIFGFSIMSVGLGVALSVWVMMVTKTIHPPAGANPIIAIYGAKSLSFIFMPVAAGAIIIILFAIMYNKILKRNYPKKLN